MRLPAVNLKGLAVSTLVLIAVLGAVWVTGANSPLQSHIRAGARAEASGDYETALKEYNLALEASPGNLDVQAKIAQVRLSRQEFKQVDDMLTALINKDETRGKALYGLLTQALLGEARQAMEKDPFNSSGSQAMTFLEQALRYSPEDQEVKQLMAKEVYTGAMRIPPNQSIALDMLKRAVSLDPNPMYRLELAYRYLALGRKAEFDNILADVTPAELADKEVQADLAEVFIVSVQGQAFASAGINTNLTEKQNLLAEGLKILPGNPALLLQQARLLASAGDEAGIRRMSEDPNLPESTRQLLANYLPNGNNGPVLQKKVYQVNTTLGGIQSALLVADSGKLVWAENTEGREGRIMELDLQSGRKRELVKVSGSVDLVGITGNDNVVYLKRTQNSGGILCLLNSKGTRELDQLAWDVRPYGPGLSPDGRFLAYVHDQELVILELETGKKIPYALSQFGVGQLLWAPDSSRLLLSPSAQDRLAGVETRLINSSGEELSRFKVKAGTFYIGWTADGRLLAAVFDGNYFYRRPQLRLVSIDDRTGTQSPAPDSDMAQALGAFPGLSPGGKFLTFTGPATGATRWGELWVMPVDKGVPHLVSTDSTFLGWSGPNKMVFADVTDSVDGAGIMHQSRIGKVTEITIGG